MINEKQIAEIRELLNKSENPLFFFDDDADGLCSFLLLYRYIGKGKGVVIKSSPILDVQFLRKVEEYSPDKIFVLDKPKISQDFIDNVHVPLVWIDHHAPVELSGGVKYFNPRVSNPDAYIPTAYLCYQVTKQNLWIAMCGIIGDWLIPEFMKKFCEQYQDLFDHVPKDPGDVLYNTKFGRLIIIVSFILKGKTSDVNNCITILSKIENPYEILNQTTSRAKFLYKRFERINKQYQELLTKAKKLVSKDKILLFHYPSKQMSFTSDLANELSYLYPDKLVVIGREKNGEMRLSFRSKTMKLPKMIEKALEDVEGYGGGHEYACGGNVKTKDFSKFLENLRKQIP